MYSIKIYSQSKLYEKLFRFSLSLLLSPSLPILLSLPSFPLLFSIVLMVDNHKVLLEESRYESRTP